MSDYIGRDREELGDALDAETKAELDRAARLHARATGRIVAVSVFAGSDTALVHRAATPMMIRLEHPSPSLSADVVIDPEGDA